MIETVEAEGAALEVERRAAEVLVVGGEGSHERRVSSPYYSERVGAG